MDRIDPSIPLEDEQDGQKFFDALCNGEFTAEQFEALESLDYQTAARVYRALARAKISA